MVGTHGATSQLLGNTSLVDYGIQDEQSDVRIHVGVYSQEVYVYKTQDGRDSIDPIKHRKVPVWTGNIQTATGYVVPLDDIKDCQVLPVPDDIFDRSGIAQYPEKGYQGEKGKAATYIASEMLKTGLIPLSLRITEVDDKKMQILGEDIRVKANIKIQVKCDYRAGNGHPRCTGNLFLQTQECNPFSIH